MEYETLDNSLLDTSNLSDEEGELFVRLLELDKQTKSKEEFEQKVRKDVVSIAEKYRGKLDSYKNTIIFRIYSDILERKC